MRGQKMAAAFNKMSLFAIAVVIFIGLLNAADLVFRLGWGYSKADLAIALIVLASAIALRFVGLRMAAFFGDPD